MSTIRLVPDGLKGRIEVDGQDISKVVSGWTLKRQAGSIPLLEVDIQALDISEIGTDAEVLYYVGGERFTWADVEGLRSGDPDTVASVAERLASILPEPVEVPAEPAYGQRSVGPLEVEIL